MPEKHTYEDIEQLVDVLEKEAAGRERARENAQINDSEEGTPERSQSEDETRVKELEIEAIERKQARNEQRSMESHIEALKQRQAKKEVCEVIEKYLTDEEC